MNEIRTIRQNFARIQMSSSSRIRSDRALGITHWRAEAALELVGRRLSAQHYIDTFEITVVEPQTTRVSLLVIGGSDDHYNTARQSGNLKEGISSLTEPHLSRRR